MQRMLGFFLEDSPHQQLLMGVFLLVAGLVIFPAMLSFLLPFAKWMNGFWSDQAWWQSAFKIIKYFMALGCTFFIVLGAGRLAVYAFVKARLIESPWI